MLTAVIVLTAFAIVIAFAFAFVWYQRQAADDLAAANAAAAAKNAERAAAADAYDSVAHDLDNIFGILAGNASTAYDMTPEEYAEAFASVESAARNGRRMVRALRGSTGAPTDESFATTLRVVTNMQRRCGTNIELNIESDLTYVGHPHQAFRIVYNLISNAARETAGSDAVIRANLTATELRITNPLKPGVVIDERIFERGFSTHGSSGLGLQIVREVAREIDLNVDYELGDGEISFVVTTEPTSASRTKSGPRSSLSRTG